MSTLSLDLDTRAFEIFPDGVAVFQDDTCIYVNPVHRILWIGTDTLMMSGSKYRAINPRVDQLFISRMVGQETLTINKGSSILYYFLYCVPLNGQYYVILTRDITENYLKNERDREYKALFNVVFNAVQCPMAIVSSIGIVNRFNPRFHQSFSDRVTLISGSFIWDYFGESRPAIKELFEELTSRKQGNQQNSFSYSGFNFMAIDQWIVVYSVTDCSTKEVSSEEDQVSDLLAFFRVVCAAKDLPWKAIVICILSIFTIVSQVDADFFLRLLDGVPPVEQSN
jgi:PAS domain-containing protein